MWECVVGNGGVAPLTLKIWPHIFIYLFKLGTLHSSPLIKISPSKFYAPWSWKRFGYLDSISSTHSQDASFTKWFFQSTFTQDIVLLLCTCSLWSKISIGTSSYDKCHAPNPKGSKAWEKHLKDTYKIFLFDNSIQIIHIKYQHQELS